MKREEKPISDKYDQFYKNSARAIIEFTKVAGYKFDIQKSVVAPSVSSEQLETEILR